MKLMGKDAFGPYQTPMGLIKLSVLKMIIVGYRHKSSVQQTKRL